VNCGSKESTVENEASEREVDAGVESIPAQSAFVAEHSDAESAVANYTLADDGSSLSIQFGASGFECDGPEAGDDVVMEIVELTDDTLVVSMNGDELTWKRQGEGSEIYGTWAVLDESGEPEFLMSIEKDGDLVISGLPEECDDDEPQGYTTDDGCFADQLPTGANIEADGYLDDWRESDVVAIQDPTDDSSPERDGDEIRELRVTSSEQALYILLSLDEPVSESFRMMSGEFGGAYNISVRHDGDGGRTSDLTIAFQEDGDNGQWRLLNGSDGAVIGIADQAIELEVSWQALGNPETIYEIQATTQDCANGPPCEIFDQGPCFSVL